MKAFHSSLLMAKYLLIQWFPGFQQRLSSLHPLSLLRIFAGNSSPPSSCHLRLPFLLPPQAELSPYASCNLPCTVLPAELDVWIPAFTELHCQKVLHLSQIQGVNWRVFPSWDDLASSKCYATDPQANSLSWWHFCHCSEWLQASVKSHPLLAVLWSGLVRAELMHTPEMVVESTQSPYESHFLAQGVLVQLVSWARSLLCMLGEWNLSGSAIESLYGNHMSKGSKVGWENHWSRKW